MCIFIKFIDNISKFHVPVHSAVSVIFKKKFYVNLVRKNYFVYIRPRIEVRVPFAETAEYVKHMMDNKDKRIPLNLIQMFLPFAIGCGSV